MPTNLVEGAALVGEGAHQGVSSAVLGILAAGGVGARVAAGAKTAGNG